MADDRLRVICGPTAAGKSALTVALADRFPLLVLSADSRQIYRRFDVGTAKPSAAELARVPHRGIDIIEPTERFSAAAWADAAALWLSEAAGGPRTPVVVGGTGFYIRALVAPLFVAPPVDPVRRAALARELDALPAAELRRWCERLDPARAGLGRAQLLRAVEVAILTGVPISRWHADSPGAPRRPVRFLLIDPGTTLRHRIAERICAMFAAGWEAEVASLAASVPADAPAWKTTGYGDVRDLVRGTVSRARALEQIAAATRQYAKRQRTWFRHQLPPADVTPLDPSRPGALDTALRWWES